MADHPLTHLLRHLRHLAGACQQTERTDRQLLQRFAVHHDEDAFALLVRRHGAMVFGVCRRLLSDSHDAEDAFQATFVLLAQKASSAHWQESVAGWLHEAARRVSCNARRLAARRRSEERQAAALRAEAIPSTEADTFLRLWLDEELRRLPEKHRTPLILCHLEGHSHEEAARLLGWPIGTVKGRIARALEQLRRRLKGQGEALSANGFAVALAAHFPAVAPPETLARTTCNIAVLVASGASVPASVSALLVGTFAGKAKMTLALAMLFGVLATGAVVATNRLAPEPPPPDERASAPKLPADDAAARTDMHGDPLPAEALTRLGTIRFRHADDITALAFTPGGKHIVSHDRKSIRIWDAATGRQVRSVLPGLDGWIDGAALTRDGKSIIAAEGQPNHFVFRLRDAVSLNIQREFPSDNTYIWFRMSPDGKYIAASRDLSQGFEFWDVTAGKMLRSWKGHERRIWDLRFSSDSKTLITCGEDKAIRFWEMPSGKLVRQITGYPSIVGLFDLSPDGALLATVGQNEASPGLGGWPRDKSVRLWNIAAGRETHLLTPTEEPPTPFRVNHIADIRFAPDGKTLATSGPGKAVHLWDPSTGKELRRIALDGFPGALAFSQDGRKLAAAAGGQSIQLIDVAAGKVTSSSRGLPGGVHFLAITPDSRTIITAFMPEGIQLWDAATGRERSRQEWGDGFASPIRLLADGHTLLTRVFRGQVGLWDLDAAREKQRFKVPLSLTFDVSPDGRIAAGLIRGDEKAVVLVQLADGKELRRFEGHSEPPHGVAFTSDGRTLVVWCRDRTAYVWDVASGRKLRQFGLNPPADPRPAGNDRFGNYTAALSPDGRLLACGCPDNQDRYLALFEIATGKPVRVLDKLADHVHALAFSANGRMLAWGGRSERIVHLVEIASGKERHSFRGHQGGFLTFAFSADGKTLISGNRDTTALVWDLTGKLAAPKKSGKLLTAKEMDAAWIALASEDAARAYDALRRLRAAPNQAVPYLRKHIRPVPVVDEKHLARLIAELDSDDFAVREKSSGELAKLGEAAVGACRKAMQGQPSAELRRRLTPLIETAERQRWSPSAERLRLLRVMEALEHTEGDEAQRLLEEWAAGMSGASLTEEAKAVLERRKRAEPRP